MTKQVRIIDIFSTFFRTGLFTLGGGLAMTTVLRHEIVLSRKWASEEDFMAELSTATLIPGAIAVNLAFLQGRRLRGLPGAAAAILGTVVPSFLIILAIAVFARPWFDHPVVAAFLKGCSIAVAGQLGFAVRVFGRRLLKKWTGWAVAASGLIVVAVFKLHPVLALLVSGIAGYFLLRIPEEDTSAGEKQE